MKEYRLQQKLMGCAFELLIVDNDEQRATALLNDGVNEIKRLETLLTEFSDTSATALLNRHSGLQYIEVPEEVYQLLKRCIHISQFTQGAFDITVGPLKKLYNFKQKDFSFPGAPLINNTLQRVGYRHIQLNQNNRVLLGKKDMHISFAAIGKGYAADCVKKLWQAKGVKHGVINASGDLTVLGQRADNSPWKVGIANPDNRNAIIGYITAHNTSVATSGDYEQFFIKDRVRYSHNIDPKNGLPLKGIKSVTIVSPSTELSDALCTAVYVMGVETGLHFINQLPHTHCLIIDDTNRLFTSKELVLDHAA